MKTLKLQKKSKLFSKALAVIPGGVNSPVRAFKAVGGNPVFAKKGRGAYFWDESGKKYLDFCNSWGALLFGHAPSKLVREISSAAADGMSFGIATRREVELAEQIQKFYPSLQKMRMTSSGTEAVMSAVRLARGFTGREKILKIDGGYHGHVDSLLVKAGSGAATFGIPDSAGIPKELAKLTLSVPFNDFEALEKIFKKHGREIATFILEPVPANMGVVLPKMNYLKTAREITRKYGALLIFDEVITGFRVSNGGAQEFFDIQPDLTVLGKILGGGMPLACFGGRREIMDCLAPLGPVYQAGTLSGNPAAVSAALWVLKEISKSAEMKKFASRTRDFRRNLHSYIVRKNLPVQMNAAGSMWTLFFSKDPVTDYLSAKKSDTVKFARFFQSCLSAGIYLAPSQFEANFLSAAQTEKDLEKGLSVLTGSISKLFR